MKRRGTRKEMTGKHKSLDRISALPQDTIEKILSLMPIRDALRTSILSRKWRYSWTSIPKLVFYDSMVVSSGNKELDKYKFFKAILHVFLQHTAPILEFSLSVSIEEEILNEIDQIILHISRRNNNIKKFVFGNLGTEIHLLPRSLFSLQRLEHLDLTLCEFEPPSMNKGFSMLKSLSFYEVYISGKILQGFLTNCPLLEKFTWIRDYDPDFGLTECAWVKLFKCLPSIQDLEISELCFELGEGSIGMPHKLPISLPHLRILVLSVCFLELSFVLCVISSSPNLEKIKIQMCSNHMHDGLCPYQETDNNLPDIQGYSGVNLDHLRELEITSFNNHAFEMDFVKLIMANSPVLKKARIELALDVSVDEEVKMLRDVVHIPVLRTSPITIERPKE